MNTLIRILYIDDYELDRELVRDALEKEHGGFLLTEASNRQAFEALLKNHDFDVILSDFNIAGFEGLQVLEIVRAHDVRIPVIIVTGTGSEEIAVKALKQGASDYVIKRPQHIRKLPQTILAVLEKQALVVERIQAEKALVQSESHLRLLVDTIPDLIWLKDQNGVYLSCNPMFERFFGAKESEIAGKTDYDFVDRDLADFFRANDRKAMAANKPSKNEEELIFADNGYQGLFETVKTPMRDSDGKLIGVLGIARDITELRKAENEKLRLERQLKHAQKMESIGNLAGGIAHDFNNILSSVIGFSELALDEVEKGTNLEENLQEVYAAGKRAKELVKQILAFARQSDETMHPIEMGPVAREVLKFIRSFIPATIEIRQTITTDSLIMGNPTQIHQMLMNLCTNAAQAMEETGGVLDVSLKDVCIDKDTLPVGMNPGEYIEIKVSDTGPGIDPDIIELIFEPYFTTKPPGEGTGMGLAVVHGIVDACGGRISVDSTLGKGAVFTIRLPIAENRKAHHDNDSEAFPSGTESILFVDDEAPIARMGRQILESLGYQVTTRTSSIEALELFRVEYHHFDLVITDMTMPNLTGDKLSAELMKIRRDIPIILCTGYSRKISGDAVLKMGIKALAYKPIVKADLARTVRQVLDEANTSKHS
ncbi:MAG: response regulator [Desulfotignum sp.]|nr:response regulator [Desulfotignum sp.]